MLRANSIFDVLEGRVTYELKGGRRVCLDERAVREYGAASILREMGLEDQIPTERVAVHQHGRKVGTLPPEFDPQSIRSKTWLYQPRYGDFEREGDHWVVSRTLGPGDLEAIPGFEREATP